MPVVIHIFAQSFKCLYHCTLMFQHYLCRYGTARQVFSPHDNFVANPMRQQILQSCTTCSCLLMHLQKQRMISAVPLVHTLHMLQVTFTSLQPEERIRSLTGKALSSQPDPPCSLCFRCATNSIFTLFIYVRPLGLQLFRSPAPPSTPLSDDQVKVGLDACDVDRWQIVKLSLSHLVAT